VRPPAALPVIADAADYQTLEALAPWRRNVAVRRCQYAVAVSADTFECV
jgi:hypothetical protein